MRGKVLLCTMFGVCLLFCTTNAFASGTMTVYEWMHLERMGPGELEAEISAAFGPPSASVFDELLSAKIAAYRIEENCREMLRGEIFYEDGVVVALRTRYSGDGRDVLRHFVAENEGYILACGDLYAIVGSPESRTVYGAMEVTSEGALAYLMDDAFYRRMADLGELPSLPPRDGRKGHAA